MRRYCPFAPRAFFLTLFSLLGLSLALAAQAPSPQQGASFSESLKPDRSGPSAKASPSAKPGPAQGAPALSFKILYRVISKDDPNKQWENRSNQLVPMGERVQLKITGKDLLVMAELLPLPLENGLIRLRIVSYIWLSKAGSLSSLSSLSTIDARYGEEIVYYPLGSERSDLDRVEIRIRMDREAEQKPEASPGIAE